MSMCNLLKYSRNYSKTSGSLWIYYRDELTDDKCNQLKDFLSMRQVLQEVLIMLT